MERGSVTRRYRYATSRYARSRAMCYDLRMSKADASQPETFVDLPWPPVDIRLLDSTAWACDLRARVLWVTVLLLASQRGAKGTVDMSTFALAKRANLSVQDTEAGLAVLTAPDPQSRYQDEGGRRLLLLNPERPWGWRVSAWKERQAAREKARAVARALRHRAQSRLTAPERK